MRKKFCGVGMLFFVLGLLLGCQGGQKPEGKSEATVKSYQAKDYSRLIGMKGFSNLLLETHFKLYNGYVKNTNMLLDQLASPAEAGRANTPEYSELKRRLGFEFNGMRLHEYYFENLGGKGESFTGSLYEAITRSFGSLDLWKKDFTSTGTMRGIGWVILYVDPQNGRLMNFWINEHEVNHPSGCKPLLVMDVWEHAYMPDYQLDRAKYMDAFFSNVDWNVVQKRYDLSMTPSAAEKSPKVDNASGEYPLIPVPVEKKG